MSTARYVSDARHELNPDARKALRSVAEKRLVHEANSVLNETDEQFDDDEQFNDPVEDHLSTLAEGLDANFA
jgi:hypothetical protein